MRAHPHLCIVHGEVDDAAPELEQRLPRIAVALELFDRVRDGLLRQAVLELEGGNRQRLIADAITGKLDVRAAALAVLADESNGEALPLEDEEATTPEDADDEDDADVALAEVDE